jgi:hypothetical protein
VLLSLAEQRSGEKGELAAAPMGVCEEEGGKAFEDKAKKIQKTPKKQALFWGPWSPRSRPRKGK